MAITTKDLGPVTAYAYAVAGGYQGTEAEFEELVSNLRDSQDMIAETFSTSKAYSVGDYCIYSGSLYIFTSAHSAGSWNASHVTEVKLADNVGELKTQIDYLEVYDNSAAAYNHSNLIMPQKITFIGNADAFGNMKFADKLNYTPSMGTGTSTKNDVVYTRNGYFLELNGTASANGGNAFLQNAPITELPAGNYKLIVYADNGTSQWAVAQHVEIAYNLINGSTTVKSINKNITDTSHSFSVTTTDKVNKVTINVAIKSGNAYTNYKLWFGLFEESATITDVGSTVASGSTYEYTLSDGSLTSINTLMHSSAVYSFITTPTLIGNMLAQKAGYVTPEQYGAIGDGIADDGTAIASAISAGVNAGVMILCAKTYKTSSTITVASNANIIMNDLVYTGSNEAIKIQGGNNIIEIKKITSSGTGLSLTGDSTSSVRNNRISIGMIDASADGIVLYPSSQPVYNNSIDFRDIKAGGSDYYCIKGVDGSTYCSENVFTGGHCHNAHYACYNLHGNTKFVNLYIEDNIKGGYYDCGGMIQNDRHWECCYYSDEAFIKFVLPSTVETVTGFFALRYTSEINLPVNQIDLSEVSKTYNNGNTKFGSNDGISIIDCPIGPYVASDGTGTSIDNPIAERAYIFADALILEPFRDYVHDVTADLDLSTIGKNSTPLPTTFVVGTADVDINLHPSYCWIGYKKFVVSQRNGYTAKVYEWYGNNCIFDGTSLGDGDFEIECYTTSRIVYADGTNMLWRYKRLNNSAGWDLINSGSFTNETEASYEISVDSNGNAFKLTDIRFVCQTPNQSVSSGLGDYGRIRAYYDATHYDLIYCGAYTQAANAEAKTSMFSIEQRDGMIQRNVLQATGNNSNVPINGRNNYGLTENSIWEYAVKTYNKIMIASATGTVNYKLYGKRIS